MSYIEKEASSDYSIVTLKLRMTRWLGRKTPRSDYSIVTLKSFDCKAVTRNGEFWAVNLLFRRGSSRFELDEAAWPGD
jgi:hypothetical protein